MESAAQALRNQGLPEERVQQLLLEMMQNGSVKNCASLIAEHVDGPIVRDDSPEQ